ncbi:MAG: SMC family ATPase [Chloroflexota bacterium]|jgi:exonuclease SbcC
MIPIRLQIQGFLSYREPVEIDFTAFDLACITGHNGAGKSTLLDAITWALFGEARRRDDALINNLESAAEVVFEFDYEANRCRVQRTKPRGKTSLLEFHILTAEGAWRQLTEHSLRETEERIRSVLRMDFETFSNASFFLQGKADLFAQQKPADRKRILSTILGLEVWETYREATAGRRKQVEMDAALVRRIIEENESELAEEGERRRRLESLEAQLNSFASLRKSREEALDHLKRLAASLEGQRKIVETLAQRLRAEQQRHDQRARYLEDRRDRQRQLQDEMTRAAEIEAAYAAWKDLRAELERQDQLASRYHPLQEQRSQLQTAIQNERARLEQELRMLDQQRGKIRQQQAGLPDMQQKLAELRSRIAALEVNIQQREQLAQQKTALKEQMASQNAEIRRLQDKMDALQERIRRLQTAETETCPLCGQPLDDSSRAALLADLEIESGGVGAEISAHREDFLALQREHQRMEHQINAAAAYDSDLHGLNRQLAALDERQESTQNSISAWQQHDEPRLLELERILAGEDFAHAERAQCSQIDLAQQALGYDAEEHRRARQAEQQARAAEEDMRLLQAARAELKPLGEEISAAERSLAGDAAEIAALQDEYQKTETDYRRQAQHLPDVAAAERELNEIKINENNLHRQAGAARQDVEVLENVRRQLAANKARSAELTSLATRLKTLERAFGKDGIPALLIEQALPEIEAQANQILDQLSNGSMAVRFETQREYKAKHREDKKETLDIIISDAAGQREYEMYSGGEAFRVNFAIRLALSRVLAHRAGARLQTLFIDEGFGSQDAEGRQRLIEAINAVRADFAKILVITHLEELKDAFPARIEVEKNARGSAARVMVA